MGADSGVGTERRDSLPAAAKAYVPALRGADQIVFSIAADASQQLQFGVHVTCKGAPEPPRWSRSLKEPPRPYATCSRSSARNPIHRI